MVIGAEATDEVAIDLEIVEREMLQVIERAETGAEIVQREAAAPAPQLRRERLGVLDVANRRRFGQLEDQTRGVDARVRERSIDDRDELRVADGLRGDIHVERQRTASLGLRWR